MSATDPIALLSAALSQPSDTSQQLTALQSLRDALESQPGRIPMLMRVSGILSSINRDRGHNGMLRTWVLDMLAYTLGKAPIPFDEKMLVASSAMDTLEGLLFDSGTDHSTLKLVIACYAALYPFVFRTICTTRQSTIRSQWESLTKAKSHILSFLTATKEKVSAGLKLASIKFAQRVVLAQTRGISDPRLQSKSDTSLSLVPTEHPFLNSQQLETEASKILQTIIPILLSSTEADLLCAVVNSFASLVTLRPPYQEFVVKALGAWTPDPLIDAKLGFSSIKSVEKSIRAMLTFVGRNSHATALQPQISAILQVQQQRMESAAVEERERRVALMNSRKRSAPSSQTPDSVPSDTKRPKLEHKPQDTPPLQTSQSQARQPQAQTKTSAKSLLSSFDFRTLPPQLVTELIVASLNVLNEDVLNMAVQLRKASLQEAGLQESSPAIQTRQEPQDPLKMSMDMDDDELEYEPDTINQQLKMDDTNLTNDADMATSVSLALTEFALPPPKRFSASETQLVVTNVLNRLKESLGTEDSQNALAEEKSMTKLKSLLLVRFISRGVEASGEDAEMKGGGDDNGGPSRAMLPRLVGSLRENMCDFVMKDLSARLDIATIWLNEEWYNDYKRAKDEPDRTRQYPIYLAKVINRHIASMNPKDRTLQSLIMDLPEIPIEVLEIVRDLCLHNERMQVGFPALREIVTSRPPLRSEAMRMLLELTTHPERLSRTAAINTIRRWIPDAQPMDRMTRQFALRMLRRLQTKTAVDGAGEEEDGQLPQEALIQTKYLAPELKLPAEKGEIQQHTELLFALCVKVPTLLDEIFSAYVTMDTSVQTAVQDHITALIRSLGSSNPTLLNVLKHFPTGSESLALRVVNIFTSNQRPSPTFVNLVKTLVTEKDLNSEFIIPIIAQMDKADIVRHLPRIVSTLNGTPEQKQLVRSVFQSVVQMPSESFGSVSTNTPRVRQSELLMPVELMVLLHNSEKEIGLKSTIEAIGICFSMTDIFRSEILAAALQQIVEEPVLPTLFMRTIIQTVSTYKSLIPYVSTGLLSRLITKKVWTDARLWEGFIMCAKRIAPASYNALLQLPKDQLRNLVEKQPALKTGLHDFVINLSRRSGNNRSKLAGYLEILGDESDNPSNPAPGLAVVDARSTLPQTSQPDGTLGQSQAATPHVSTPTMA